MLVTNNEAVSLTHWFFIEAVNRQPLCRISLIIAFTFEQSKLVLYIHLLAIWASGVCHVPRRSGLRPRFSDGIYSSLLDEEQSSRWRTTRFSHRWNWRRFIAAIRATSSLHRSSRLTPWQSWAGRQNCRVFLGQGILIGLFHFPPTHASLHGQGPALKGKTRQCLGLLELGYTLTDLADLPLAFKGKPLDSLSLIDRWQDYWLLRWSAATLVFSVRMCSAVFLSLVSARHWWRSSAGRWTTRRAVASPSTFSWRVNPGIPWLFLAGTFTTYSALRHIWAAVCSSLQRNF